MNESVPPGSFDGVGNGGYDDRMDARVSRLETDVAAIKLDIAVIKATGATKSDIADLRAETQSDIAALRAEMNASIGEAKNSIIMWVVSAIFLAQLLPMLLQRLAH